MINKGIGFVSLLAVIGVSIVFGMLIGGRLNAPQPMFASESGHQAAAPAGHAGGAPVIDFADVVENALPAVVSITSQFESEQDQLPQNHPDTDDFFRWFFGPDTEPRQEPRERPRLGGGSGFIISSDGFILTNNHVVDDAVEVKVSLQGGKQLEAEIVGSDPSIDLALLKVDAGDEELPTLPLGNSGSLRVGEWVIAIGSPLDYGQTVTAGVLSAKKRRVPLGDIDRGGLVTFLQTDAAINFGNSGGPLLDAQGRVIGINMAISRSYMAEGIGFALPIDQVRAVIDQLRERGHVKRGYLGISMSNSGIDEDARDYLGLPDNNGVVVEDVTPGSPADEAGVLPDDVIRKVDGEVVTDNDDLIATISARQPGEKVKLQLFRDGRDRSLTVTLTERPQDIGTAGRNDRRRDEEERDRESSGLGITVEDLTPQTRRSLRLDSNLQGVLVVDVDFGTLAEQKGVARGMVVTAINGAEIRSVADWDDRIAELRPGAAVKLNTAYRTAAGGLRHFTIFLRAPAEE
jgi:serine protease Do